MLIGTMLGQYEILAKVGEGGMGQVYRAADPRLKRQVAIKVLPPFSHGQPTILVRDVGAAARFSSATRDHSRILIRVNPDSVTDKGEIRLLFGWQDALRQRR